MKLLTKSTDNIIDYAKKERRSFQEKPLTIVDSLIFSQIAYINFGAVIEDLSDDRVEVALGFFAKKPSAWEKMFTHTLSAEKTAELLWTLAKNPRYAQIKLNYYVEERDKKLQKQFSAVSFLLNENTTYVAFRGTDDSILGWKEDLNMTFLHTAPSQREAAEYLKKVAEKTTGKLIVGGHSKGGNLATYAALMAPNWIKARIKTIYSHDGPGLNQDWWQSLRMQTIKNKINKTLPQSSPIGILLEKERKYRIIKSTRHSVMQHDPFSWIVKDDDFVNADKMARSVRYLDRSLSDWLDKIPNKKRELFVDTLYQILVEVDITRVRQFTQLTPQKIGLLLSKFHNIDDETKAFIKQTLANLVKLYVHNIGKN